MIAFLMHSNLGIHCHNHKFAIIRIFTTFAFFLKLFSLDTELHMCPKESFGFINNKMKHSALILGTETSFMCQSAFYV